jgi:hypothetical protein
MQMHWEFSLILTERAFNTVGIHEEQRAEIQRLLGNYDPRFRQYHFKDHPPPEWMSRPITVRYERWGESLERWTVWNSWVSLGLREQPTYHEKRVSGIRCQPFMRQRLSNSGVTVAGYTSVIRVAASSPCTMTTTRRSIQMARRT